MKSVFLLLTTAVAFCMVLSCNRSANTDPGANNAQVITPNPNIKRSNARQVGAGFSQPISLDTANKMIGSYLSSINYPYQDTALRSLAFNADTLRAYLNDSRITSVEFHLAHHLTYLNGGADRFGKNIGMRPGALTIIAVGYDNNGAVIRNSSNGVYEYAMPCPNNCPNTADAFLH